MTDMRDPSEAEITRTTSPPAARRFAEKRTGAGARGTSTVEMLVASAAAFLVLASCTRTMLAQHELWRLQEARHALREGARRVSDAVSREIRAAGFDPLPGGPFDGSLDALSLAAPAEIVLLADHSADGAADPDSDERIGFRRGAAQRTVHETIGGLVVPLLDGIDVAPGGLRFRYFDACGRELVPDAAGLDPTARAAVRRVELFLALVDPSGRGRVEAGTVISLRNRQELACRS